MGRVGRRMDEEWMAEEWMEKGRNLSWRDRQIRWKDGTQAQSASDRDSFGVLPGSSDAPVPPQEAGWEAAGMATEVSGQGGQRAIGHEEYSLYSSLSEDELLQMAVEQSLADKTRGPAPEAVGAHLHPRTR